MGVITGLRFYHLGIENLNKLVIITNNWPNDPRYCYSNEFLNVVVTRLTYLSLGLGLCVSTAILKHTTCNFLGCLCYVSLLHSFSWLCFGSYVFEFLLPFWNTQWCVIFLGFLCYISLLQSFSQFYFGSYVFEFLLCNIFCCLWRCVTFLGCFVGFPCCSH